MSFILLPENLPFTVALAVMLGIALLEGAMTMLGTGLSQFLDDLIPDGFGEVDVGDVGDLSADVDVDVDVDLDTDFSMNGHDGSIGHSGVDGITDGAHTHGPAEIGSQSALSRLLGWLCVGRVPVLILLIAFLTVFGLSGLFVQSFLADLTGTAWSGWLVSIPALFIAVPSVRLFGLGMAKLIPSDETSAVSSKTFIGRVATITLGTARRRNPAQAKLHDKFGQVHYVMVEPDIRGEKFVTGDDVLIVRKTGSVFRVIKNTSAGLTGDR